MVYAVYKHNGYLWLPSDYGLMQFDPSSGRVVTYLERDGVAHNEFNRVAHTTLTDGRFVFGGMNGMTYFHPEDFTRQEFRQAGAPLIWNACSQFDGNRHHLVDITPDVLRNGVIRLSNSKPFASLQFAMLAYADTRQIEYAYRIDGVDDEWTYTKDNTLRLGRQMPYGAHTLRVKAQGVNGRWSANELTLTVMNIRPLYARWWFVIGLVSIALGALWWWNYSRVRRYERRQLQLEETVAKRTARIRADKAIIEEQARRLQDMEQVKSRFYTNISHELRTPLSLILGPLNTLGDNPRLDEPSKKMLNYARRNARGLLKLVNELLDLSKLERKDIQPDYSLIDVPKWVPSLMSRFEVGALHKQIALRFEESASAVPLLRADADMLAKILSNYLSNALKHTPPGGEIAVAVTATKEWMRLSVADNGPGIDKDHLPHVFDRYYQTTDMQPGLSSVGTGVGLAHAAELAKLMRGRVWAESRKHAGSTFYLDLPLQLPLTPEGEQPQAIQGAPLVSVESTTSVVELPEDADPPVAVMGNSGKRGRILLVEDHPELRSYITTILPEYEVHACGDGAAAQHYLEQHPDWTDLIISDYMMPVMDGEGLLRFVKGDDRFRHLPFILLTAHSRRDTRLSLLRMGIDDYLTKPFDEEELKARIASLLGNAHLRKTAREEVTEADPLSMKSTATLTEADTEWMQRVEAEVNEAIEKGVVNVTYIAERLNLSERQFRRKVKQVIGVAPKQYLQEIQMQYAKQLLESGREKTIKAIADRAAFGDAKYFSRSFKKRFGKSPTHYLEEVES